MDNLQWIKELIRSELTMQETGKVEFKSEFRTQESLRSDTIAYLTDLKSRFVTSCSAFNQLKGSAHGRIKIYGLSKTEADFMVFRKGYKLVFSMKDAGKVLVTISHVGSNFIPGQKEAVSKTMEQDILLGKWKAFGRLTWTHEEQEIETDYLVRHYLSHFIRVSANNV